MIKEGKSSNMNRADFIRTQCQGHTNFDVLYCGEFRREVQDACVREGFARPSSAQIDRALRSNR